MFSRIIDIASEQWRIAFMQVITRIRKIEDRAAAINLSLSSLCRAEGLHLSTIDRWRNGLHGARSTTVERVLGRLEAALEKRERDIAIALEKAGKVSVSETFRQAS